MGCGFFRLPVLSILSGLLFIPAQAIPQANPTPWEKTEALGKKLAELKRDDPKAWLKLALWCEKSGLSVETELCFRSAVRLDPENAEARKKLGHLKKDGAWLTRIDQARADADKKKEKGLVPFGLDWVKPDQRDALLKKERADVGWTFDRKIQGAHWTIYTDAPDETAARVLEVAEAMYDAFVAETAGVLPLAIPAKPIRAYVFKDRERFMKEANLPTAWAEGYYDGGRRACFCYYDPTNAKNPTHWFVHEAEHQLLAELVVNPSGLNAWLSEGYACYFGTSRFAGGELKLGQVDPDTYPAWFRKQYPPGKFWPLGEFADRIAPKFGELGDPNPFYLESWLLVHYLMNGEDGKYRAAFRRFFAEAAKGHAETAAFEKTVAKLSDLQEGFLRYAKEMQTK